MPTYTPIPTPTPLTATIFSTKMLDTFAKAYPNSDLNSRFAKDFYLALQNHTPLTLFQKVFIFIAAFFPGPFSWKLAVFSYVYTFSPVPIFLVLMVVAILLIVLYLIRQYLRQQLSRKEPLVFLELTIPSNTAKSAYATEQFFTLLHSLAGRRRVLHRFIGHKKRYSLELLANREQGIRYILAIPKTDAGVIEKGLLSYVPGLVIRPGENYLNEHKTDTQRRKIVELKLASDFVLPLSTQKELTEHDPIAYLTGNMTKLKKNEQMAFQVVVTPVSKSTHRSLFRHLAKIRQKVARNEPLSDDLFNSPLKMALSVPMAILKVLHKILEAVGALISGLIATILYPADKSAPLFPREITSMVQQILNPYEKELQIQVKEKMGQPLFELSARLLIVTNEPETIHERVGGFLASVGPFASPYQSLELKSISPDITSLWSRFTERRISTFNNPILTPSELTDLYHFPFTDTTKTEGLVTNKSRDLPAPLSQKRNESVMDVIIGTNSYGGEETPVGLTPEERHQHTYIVGKTGMGKSTIIAGMALQDMEHGKGLAVIDPHGDLVKKLLTLIPEHRRNDVVYIDPADKEFPVGLNILNPGTQFSDLEEEHEWITGSVMSVFMKITPKDKWGQRMEHILRNATLTALAISSQEAPATLFTIQKLLTDTSYRKQVASTLKDPILKQFWQKEFVLFGSMQQADAISPLTNKLGEFFTSPLSRRILLQEKSSINLTDIMDSGKILLVNLSKGELGEERSTFFGTIIVSLIQLATYARAKKLEDGRRDFFVYIDEFQNFATSHFTSLFSESRKYHVFFIPTHQSIAQIEDSKITSVISGNAGTLISLKTGPDDEAFILPFMRPEVGKGAIVNLAPHHFFMKVTSGVSEDSFSGETIPLTTLGSEDVAESIIAHSRKQYATPKAVVEGGLEKLLAEAGSVPGQTKKPTKPKSPPAKAASRSTSPVTTVVNDGTVTRKRNRKVE